MTARPASVRALPDVMFIEKRKRPDGSGFWGCYRTDEEEDASGIWLFTPRGSLYRGEKAGQVAYCKVGSPAGPGIPVMHLIPRDGWWIATFWPPAQAKWSVTFDICTPPQLERSVWTYDDLELDVWVAAATGALNVEDEDDFHAACREGHISPGEAKAATAAVDAVRTLIHEPGGDFVRHGIARLLEATRRKLPPITRPPARDSLAADE